MSGILYLVATPIGNLDDITLRALKTLEEVDYIAAEDTRHTLKLLNHFNLKKPLESYHEHNKFEKGKKIIQDIKEGKKVALVTDAGTPAISDPGEDLVKLIHEEGLIVTSIPGPAALINGLILSGKDTRRFCFEGFLPHNKKERNTILKLLKNESRTIILYESPHKLKNTLEDLLKTLGNRKVSIIREITKRYEEVALTTFEEMIIYYKENDPRGEYVIVIEGIPLEKLEQQKVDQWLDFTLEEHMKIYIDKNMPKKEAIKQIAKDRHMPKREVYDYFNR